jgi:two-component system response regulator DegU
MTNPTKILIVDDHLMFREGIRSRLQMEPGFEVIGEAASADEALGFLEEHLPHVIILDIRMPGGSGIELAGVVRKRWPDVKILVLSGYDFDQYVRRLASIGIEGYLLKEAPQETLVNAIREIADGGAVLPPQIASKVMRSYAADTRKPPADHLWELTMRELDVLELLHQGLRNADIADRLGISGRTVETHVSNIISKMGARGRTEAVKIAAEKGLLK